MFNNSNWCSFDPIQMLAELRVASADIWAESGAFRLEFGIRSWRNSGSLTFDQSWSNSKAIPPPPPPTAKLVQSPTWPNGNSLAPMEMNLNLGREYAGINYNRSQCNLIKIADSYLVNWVLRVLSDFTERFHRRQSKRKPIVLKREIRWVHSSSHIYWRAITSDIKC